MPRKATPKPKRKPQAKRKASDPAQLKRFLETAKSVEASDDPKAFERVLKAVAAASAARSRSKSAK